MVNRRQLLCLAASTLTAAVARSVRAGSAKPQDASVRFGFSLYGMKTLETDAALKACAEIGYDGVELALMPGWATEPKLLGQDARRDLRKRLEDSNLALLGLMENLREPVDDGLHRANLDKLKAATELGQALSPKEWPVIETIVGNKPAQWEQVKQQLVERLGSWAEVAAAAKTVIAIKPHVGNALHTPEAAVWLVQQVKSPWIKLAYDYSHFVLRGLPLAQTVAALMPSTAFIHVKDAQGNADKFKFLLPGDGGIDYLEYAKLLKEARYRGPLVVEVSGQISGQRDYDPRAAARRSYANLAPVLKKSGLRP
ncbi:MAG: sugar phosphate isomerase/epimerase family protein [Gemmataceae bacterium]